MQPGGCMDPIRGSIMTQIVDVANCLLTKKKEVMDRVIHDMSGLFFGVDEGKSKTLKDHVQNKLQMLRRQLANSQKELDMDQINAKVIPAKSALADLEEPLNGKSKEMLIDTIKYFMIHAECTIEGKTDAQKEIDEQEYSRYGTPSGDNRNK